MLKVLCTGSHTYQSIGVCVWCRLGEAGYIIGGMINHERVLGIQAMSFLMCGCVLVWVCNDFEEFVAIVNA